MGSLIKLAAWVLIESSGAGNARAATTRLAAAALCAGLAGVLTMAALGCVATALWIFALPSVGAVGAPLVVAAALAIVTLILVTAAWLIIRRNRRRSGAGRASQLLLSEATRLFNEHKGALLLSAAVAGMAAANGRKS